MIRKIVLLIITIWTLSLVNDVFSQRPPEMRNQRLQRNPMPRLIDLSSPLNDSTYKLWDSYIHEYAPSDSAFLVVVQMASRHFNANRAAVAKYIYEGYRDLFVEMDSVFNSRIHLLEQIMLTQTPELDTRSIYHNFILKNAPSEDAFVAVQRLTDTYVSRKFWDSALFVYEYYRPYFPPSQRRFEKIIEILNAPMENLAIRNLGNMVNTRGNEWDPTPTPDGRYLYFTADSRPGGKGRSDIWVSEKVRGEWQLPTNLGGSINSFRDETIDNVTVDGTTLLLSGDFGGSFGEFDIYIAEKDSSEWKSLTHLPNPINTQYHEESGCLTADGKAMLFTSDRPGGIGPFVAINQNYYHGSTMGNMDIYVSLLNDDGNWGEPINLGPTINTPYAERSVFLHPDGKTLYFSSDGHPGLGRLDVFKSVRLSDSSWTEWSEPVNLGKEINSANDDWGYEVDISGTLAYFAGNNYVIGYGGWDIYSISLPDRVRPERVVTVRGKVTDLKGKPLSSIIKWEDLETGEIVGTLKSDPRDGYYFIALKPGRLYGYYAEKSGYYSTSNNIDLREEYEKSEINENISLASILELQQQNHTIKINNLFFDFNKSELKKESFPELNRLANFLSGNKQIKIVIEGHTDNIGTASHNYELSIARATSVSNFLTVSGIAPDRIKIAGYGANKPIAPNDTEENRALNRRVNIIFQN